MTDVVYEEREGLSGISDLDFDPEKLAAQVADAVLSAEGCPFEAEVCLTITDDGEIREVNRENRGIDRATDVLSFPVCGYSRPAAFDEAGEDPAGNFDPESGRLLLGDILISSERMRAQAEEYGHSVRREFAFLVAHSVLHLIGYDHEIPEEETVMFAKQEAVLTSLGITRDS